MLILHSMPAVTAATLTAGSWLVADAGSALYDGKPTRKAGFSWPSGATSITQYVGIQLTFATATRLRGFAALGLSLPEGVRVEFYATAGQGLGGSTDSDRTRRMPDGSIGLFAVADDTGIEDTGCEMRIYNDCNGVTWATAGMAVYIGELFAGDGCNVRNDAGWVFQRIDPSEVSESRASQLNIVARSPYRRLPVTLSLSPEAHVRYGGLDHGQDWDSLARATSGGQRCVAIPRWKGTAGEVDGDKVNATAVFGICEDPGETQHIRGPFWRRTMTFREIPAR